MKAIILTRYGSSDGLKLGEVPKPTAKENEVLIKIHASAVNDYDWAMMTGKPYLYRLLFGILKPKFPIPGMELSGKVEAIGADVTSLKIGDSVYGDISGYGFGSFAEYISINEKAVTLKPKKMTFEEAASIPHASMLAVQGLIDAGKIEQGQSVLINGAGGGVGTFGLQLAKLYGSEVTGVDTGDKLKMMKSIGFDHVIDYRKEDFTRNGLKYDLILDAKTSKAPMVYLKSLKTKGRYVTVGGNLVRIIQLLLLKWWVSRISDKSLHMVGLKPNKDLEYINKLFEEGQIKPVIDGPYTLDEIPRLIQYFGDGKHTGKVVILTNKLDS